MRSEEEIRAYRKQLKDLRDDVAHHGFECEITGRIRAIDWMLDQRIKCPKCEHGFMSPIYESDNPAPVEHVCDRCGHKV